MNIGSNLGVRPNWNSNYGPGRGPSNDNGPRGGGPGEDGLDLSDIGQQTMSHLKDRKPLLHLLQNTQPVQHHFSQMA